MMKVKLLFLLPLFVFSSIEWQSNLTDAEQIAQKEHKYVLLNFSGSDWCGPCMRLHKEFFESAVFKEMADKQLVLVNADFPRKKKNQLPIVQQKLNDEMADKYNPQGKFPYTLLLDAQGKVLKTWEGLPDETPDAFTDEVSNGIYTNSKQ